MNQFIKKIAEKATTVYAKGAAKVNANSPEIFLGVGIAMILGGCVLLHGATLKCEEVLADAEDHKKQIEETAAKHPAKYTDEDQKRDRALLCVHTVYKVGQVYGPSALLILSGIISILHSHGIMKKRQATLLAAYGALEETYRLYRKHVIEAIGEENERAIRLGKKHKFTIKELDEQGNEVEKKVEGYELKDRYDERLNSPYSKIFDETNDCWKGDPDLNRYYLLQVQSYFNDKLRRDGYVFLNDVYDELGFKKTPIGQISGWLKNGDGDGFIDFGICNSKNEEVRRFVNGYEYSILLDFNVDGKIWDRI